MRRSPASDVGHVGHGEGHGPDAPDPSNVGGGPSIRSPCKVEIEKSIATSVHSDSEKEEVDSTQGSDENKEKANKSEESQHPHAINGVVHKRLMHDN